MEFYTRSNQKFLMDLEDALLFVGVSISISSNGYLRITSDHWVGDRYLHRYILKAKKGQSIDHINGNKLDNRKENLRICTHQQNMCNTKLSIKNKTGVKGVHWSEERQKWSAQIAVQNKTISLGRFISFDEAVKARLSAEQQFHGEFSRK